MATTTAIKEAVLRKLYRNISGDDMSGLSLKKALEAWADAILDGPMAGNQITSVTSNGHTTQFASPVGSSMSQEDMVETSTFLLRLLEQVLVSETLTDDEGDNDDVYAAMLLRMAPNKVSVSRFNTYEV